MPNHRELRRRLKKSFASWVINQPGPRLISLKTLDDEQGSNFALVGIAREIVISVSREISVAAMRGDACWDLLADFGTLPEQNESGKWRCGYKRDTDTDVFDSVEALWQARLFEPLANWILQTIQPAEWLEFHEAHGVTWARLANELEEPRAHLVAIIRVHGSRVPD